MELDGELLEAAMFAVAEVCRTRGLADRPIPRALRRLHDRLELAVRVSGAGQPGDAVHAPSGGAGLVGSAEAAEMLGQSQRQVLRIAADLDGLFVAGRWLFDRAAVTEYAESRNHGRSPNSA